MKNIKLYNIQEIEQAYFNMESEDNEFKIFKKGWEAGYLSRDEEIKP